MRRIATPNYAVIIRDEDGLLFINVERQDGDGIVLVEYAGDDDVVSVLSEEAEALEVTFT